LNILFIIIKVYKDMFYRKSSMIEEFNPPEFLGHYNKDSEKMKNMYHNTKNILPLFLLIILSVFIYKVIF